jgi:hypothetical protein
MPWCEIPTEKLEHIGLFGYDVIMEDGKFLWLHGPKGRLVVERARPRLWFEDVGEAVQAGAIAIILTK